IPVEIANVQTGDIDAYYTGTATIEAKKEAIIVAKTSGIVKNIFVEEGDNIEVGQTLTKLDDERQLLELKRVEIELKNIETELNRLKALYNKKYISDEDFEKIQFDYDYKKNLYELAKLDLEYTSIKASIKGVVTKRYIKEGNMVSYNEPTFEIVNFESLILFLFVPESELSKLKINQEVKLKIDALKKQEFYGKIERINPVIDPNSGTCKITIKVNNPKRIIKPGMFARVSIVYDVHQNTLLIPKDAVISADRESIVFVVKDSIVYKKVIKTGYSSSTSVEILDGLQYGDMVVTIGKSSLKDSAKVEVIK
ncbi:MAG: efflux RND transporter periplasmic adaptor subunit, partial [Candidatus Cloacimonetes bacterium]|nr:efflux RND transporter periplasmic adaptor subunit [Candidatus Cloacimonadota bacterium]